MKCDLKKYPKKGRCVKHKGHDGDCTKWYQQEYKIGNQIKLLFKIRGELKPLEEDGSEDFIGGLTTAIEKSPDLIGVAETPWGEILKISDTELIIELLNEPLYQLDKKNGTQIKKWDVCVFERIEYEFPVFKRLAKPEEYLT